MISQMMVEWSANFAVYDEREKSIMKKKNELASLISSQSFGSEEMLIEEYV